MREANCSGHLHPAWHLTASILHILSASLKLLKVKSYIAFCGKKIPEGWSRLCHCVSSWKCRKCWRTGCLCEHTDPASLGRLQPTVLMLTSPWTGLCTSVLYRNFVDHLPLCKNGLVIYCTVLDSMAPAKNQPSWKAAKKFQQCESRNKLGTSITIAAIARISATIFPPMCELFSLMPWGTEKASTRPEPAQQDAPPPCFQYVVWYRGITPCSFSQVLPSNYNHCENFSSPWILQSAFNTSSCLQLLIYWVQLQSRPAEINEL